MLKFSPTLVTSVMRLDREQGPETVGIRNANAHVMAAPQAVAFPTRRALRAFFHLAL